MKLYDYLSDNERSLLAMESAFDVEMRSFDATIGLMCESTEIELEKARVKVMMENGTSEDYQYLCEAQQEEASAKGDGIIRKIITSIKNFFRNIKNKIMGLFKSGNESEAASKKNVSTIMNFDKIDIEANKLIAEGKGLVQKLLAKANISDETIDAFKEKCSNLKGIAIAAGTVATGAIVLKNIKKGQKTGEEAEKTVETVEKSEGKLANMSADIKSKLSKVLTSLGGVGSTIMNKTAIITTKLFGKSSDSKNTDYDKKATDDAAKAWADNGTVSEESTKDDIFGLEQLYFAAESAQ